MKYPLKALMPLDSEGKHMSDEAWERSQRLLARLQFKYRHLFNKEA